MRHQTSILTHLKNSVRHLDALEMTKAFQTINFASLLALGRAELLKYDLKEGLETRHEVTPYYCRKDSRGPYLSAAVVTALFDEVSTSALILQDRTHRPGVSVTLHVDMLDTYIAPGSTVRLRTWASKLGQTLAFLDMHLVDDKTSRLLATGRHVKFQANMGQLWDLAFLPALYPFLRRPIKAQVKRHLAKGESMEVEEDAWIGEHFALEGLKMGAKGGQPTTAHFDVRPRHCNGFFAMHGGALAILAEEIAVRDASDRLGRCVRARSVDLNYLNSNARRVDVAAWMLQTGTEKPWVSEVEARRNGRLNNQAIFTWDEALHY